MSIESSPVFLSSVFEFVEVIRHDVATPYHSISLLPQTTFVLLLTTYRPWVSECWSLRLKHVSTAYCLDIAPKYDPLYSAAMSLSSAEPGCLLLHIIYWSLKCALLYLSAF